MENEFQIDFNKLQITDSEYDEGCYTAVLEYGGAGNPEETARFQYEVMKKAGLDDDLRDVGIEVDSFEKFQELNKDDATSLQIQLTYSEFAHANADSIVANALYGENSTHFSDVPLSSAEKESLNQFIDEVLLDDKKNLQAEYDNEKE